MPRRGPLFPVSDDVSVWDLDDDDRILRENVYYDPETMFACGWEQAEE